MISTPPEIQAIRDRRRLAAEHRAAYEARRAEFARALGLSRLVKWSTYNLSRMLRHTGERPERVESIRALLRRLGMDCGCGRQWIGTGGVFDHGEMWSRDGHPAVIVGHPYGISTDEEDLLAALARGFPTLRVTVDDRPSYYGHGTNHVRIELAAEHRPYRVPPATHRTRAYARRARKAFRESFASGHQP